MKFRKMSLPFAHLPGISGIFGRMESAQDNESYWIRVIRLKIYTEKSLGRERATDSVALERATGSVTQSHRLCGLGGIAGFQCHAI